MNLSNEMEAVFFAASYRREMGDVPRLAAWYHIPIQEIRIGFREYDETHTCISLETLNLELHGA
jgi:hypothetical protein